MQVVHMQSDTLYWHWWS